MTTTITPKPNGLLSNGADASTLKTNGISAMRGDASESIGSGLGLVPLGDTSPEMGQLPPEIDHIVEGYQPLAKLITRVVQETFRELVEVVDKMADMDIHQPSNDKRTNGFTGFNAKINVDKKMLFMNFIQKRRAQFIKLLVLTQWSRDSEEVSRLIDLKVWLDRQTNLYEESAWWLYELKKSLEPAKQPNPNLGLALKVLTTGGANWYPDLGYIASKPLSPQGMLKALRNLNILLHVRLNLHEDLPKHFNTFTIANGRATFAVENEFEVDVSIGEDDPQSQLYFIDLRFTFSPALANIPDGPLRNQISETCNFHLKEQGLAGLYDYLHEYTLTTKINVLRRQAHEMNRNLWTGTLGIEFLHRTLVIQYWKGRPGPKHWIEISAFSGNGKTSDGRVEKSRPSFLGVRWVRDGKRTSEGPTRIIDENDLSMEKILKQMIGRHIKHIFVSTRKTLLENPLYSTSALDLTVKVALKEPVESWFKLQLTSSQTATIVLQPITGVFSISPSTPFTSRAEMELNALPNPAVEAAPRLLRHRSFIAQSEVDQRMTTLGWSIMRIRRTEEVNRALPTDMMSFSLYKRPEWSGSWYLSAVFGKNGDEWKVMDIDLATPTPVIRDTQSVTVTTRSGKAPPNDYNSLSRIARAATGLCCLYVNSRALTASNVQYRIHHLKNQTSSDPSAVDLPVLALNFASFFSQASSSPSSPPPKAPGWADPRLILSYEGQDPSNSHCLVTLESRLLKAQSFKSVITRPLDQNITYNPDKGSLRVLVSTPLGEPCTNRLLTVLHHIDRLLRFLVTITSYKLRITSVSLSHVTFAYSTPPQTATIGLSTTGPLTLTLNKQNPHLLLLDHLIHSLNSPSPISRVILTMTATLPVCRALVAIQSRASTSLASRGEVFVLPRSPLDILLTYVKPGLSFRVHARHRHRGRSETYWVVAPTEEIPAGHLREALLAKWGQHGVPGKWRGLGSRVAASFDGIEEILEELDKLIEDKVGLAKDEKAAAAAVPQPVSAPPAGSDAKHALVVG